MLIHGFQKTTLLDFPEKVACTVFTGGCNFRCPFCHNASLVTHIDPAQTIPEEEIFSYLKKRKGILDGVCVTGGEPLLQPDLARFCRKIHDLGLLVKLDTNGSFPERLNGLLSEGLVDYIAMDIKNALPLYPITCGLDHVPDGIEESIRLIMSSGLPYEFRTTVVRELHTKESLTELATIIRGAERYFLQSFTDSGDLIGTGLSAYSEEETRAFLPEIQTLVPSARLRGI
ncbi:MAG: anaerobic ribonucleoside-triphosphate reductase activating protein [Clostridia bacterium]|nr:anaerobic ribonucleoside-triphosphate reductase activating protein [Clostridia bacterium]